MIGWPLQAVNEITEFINADGVYASVEKSVIERVLSDFALLKRVAGIEAQLLLIVGNVSKAVIGDVTAVCLCKRHMQADRDVVAFICAHELAHLKCDMRQGWDAEFEADRLAIDYMTKAGFDPTGAIRFFETANLVESPAHPSSKNRIEALANPHLER